MKRFDLALDSFERAVQVNPNDSLAWLLKSTMHSFKGEGDLAMQGAGLALRLSPLDPRRWYYDSLAATAALSAGLYDQAMDLARRSIRSNRTHTSSYRTLAVAQVFSGQVDDARQTTAQLMRLQPDLTVTQYRQRHPAANFTTGTGWANALKQAGVPA
jgi:tetratricopeptide (TPR) repeat protein